MLSVRLCSLLFSAVYKCRTHYAQLAIQPYILIKIRHGGEAVRLLVNLYESAAQALPSDIAMADEKLYRELPRRELYEEMKLHLFSRMS